MVAIYLIVELFGNEKINQNPFFGYLLEELGKSTENSIEAQYIAALLTNSRISQAVYNNIFIKNSMEK